MAPKFAPKVWKRPYTSIYNDNYRFGNSLYSEQISDIERKYNESLASTRLGSDRLDLGLSTFSDSQLVGANALAKQRSDRAHENYLAERVKNSISMPRASATIHDSDVRRLQHSPSIDSYSSRIYELEENASRLRHSASRPRLARSSRPESSHYSAGFDLDSAKPSENFWMERCKDMQVQIESLKQELNDTQDKVKHGRTFVQSKVNEEIADLMHQIDDQDRQIVSLQKLLKKQAKQVSDLSLELEASQRQYTDVNEQLVENQKKSSNMAHEIEHMRSNLEKVNVSSSCQKTELHNLEQQCFNTTLASDMETLNDAHNRTLAMITRQQRSRKNIESNAIAGF